MVESLIHPLFIARILLSIWTFCGAIKSYKRANDFLSHTCTRIRKAKEEIWFVGANFYITAPEHRLLLVEKLRKGVDVKFLIFDFLSSSLPEVAESFSNSEQEFRAQCQGTVESLRIISEAWQQLQRQTRGQLDIRLSTREPKLRFYFYDQRRLTGYTYFVPHVVKQDSPNLPGFLVRNMRRGIVSRYATGVQQLWDESQKFKDWLPKYEASQGN